MDCVWLSGVAEAMRPLRVRVHEGTGDPGRAVDQCFRWLAPGSNSRQPADQSRVGPCPKELRRCRTGVAQPENSHDDPVCQCASAPRAGGGQTA
jgi:hypothetical protein